MTIDGYVRLPLYFRCEPLGCALEPAKCAARYRRLSHVLDRSGGRDRFELGMVHRASCVGCPVGAAHADERAPRTWPDGKLVVRSDSPRGLGYNAHVGACMQRTRLGGGLLRSAARAR